ncbi:MAG: MaoC/PaaZ C-terminal domain-containing protein [Pseudomonadota bacterium]
MPLSRPTRVELDRTFVQDDFDAFADLSGDDNPIHVDHAFSASTRFGRTVSHGVLLYTVLRGLCDRLLPGCGQVEQALKFTAPTYANEPMRFTATVTDDTGDGMVVALEVVRIADGVITCSGETRLTAPEASP